MNPVERAARAVDRAQQGFGPAAFVYGVIKKFGDDRAGSLAALVAYYGFVSLFPLLLLMVTMLGIVAGNSSSLTHSVESSALAKFPVIGNELGKNIHELHRHSTIGLVVGILGLLWGSQGVSQAGQYAMAQIWNVPNVVRPNFWARLVRTLLLMGVLGVFLALSTGLTVVAGLVGSTHLGWRVAALVASAVVNVALYVSMYRILTPKQIDTRRLLPGAVLGGLAWTLLLISGTIVVNHTLRDTSQVYGFFAVVLGLLAWIYLVSEISLYTAEVNVVWHRRLWPRAIVQPPLTEADRRVLAAIARQEARRPELEVEVHPGTAAEDRGPEEKGSDENGPEEKGSDENGSGGKGGHENPEPTRETAP